MELRGFHHQGHALGIAGDASQDNRILQDGQSGLRIAQSHRVAGWVPDQGRRLHPFALHRAHHPPVERGVDRGHGHAHLQGADHRPEAGALLAGHIEDLLDQITPILRIPGAKTHLGDLHQIGGELFELVPAFKHSGHGQAVQAGATLHEVVGLDQDLLDAVLDAVVDGLDEMAGATWTHVGHTGAILHLGRHLAHQGFDRVVGRPGAAGHHARTLQRPLGSAGDAHADISETLAFELLDPSLCVGVKRVAAVDQQVVVVQEG